MRSLIRTRVSIFDIADARTLDEIERIVNAGNLDGIMLPLDQAFEGMPTVFVIPEENAIRLAINGAAIEQERVFAESLSAFEEGVRYRVYLPDNRFLGVYSFIDSKFKLEKFFLE